MTELTAFGPNLLVALTALSAWGTGLGMFFLSDWRLTRAGRSYLGMTVAFATLLTMNTIHLYVGTYPGIMVVRYFVYGFLLFASLRIGWTVWSSIIHGKPADKGYTIHFDDDREDERVN